jgi:CRP-like cAMP-binding protein
MDIKNVQQKLAYFFSQYPAKKFKKGEVLIESDKAPDGVFYLKDGVVINYAVSEQGQELILNTFKAVSFFPMGYALNDSLSPYYYQAQTEVEVYQAPKDKVVEFIKQNPEVMFDLLKRIYRGLDGYMQRMEYLMIGQAYKRLVTELMIAAKRFGEKNGQATTIKLHFTQQELASLTGEARETISREMKILQDKGLIQIKDKLIEIPDLTKLQQELV